jgi:hypothetical protein
VERLFSHSDKTIANRRICLDADKVNNLLFIKRNIRALKEIDLPVMESCTKRKNSFISTDSTSLITLNKKIKLMTESQDIDEVIN